MNSPYSMKSQIAFDSPYKASLYSSTQTPSRLKYQSSQPLTPKKPIKISPKPGFKFNELRDPMFDYQMRGNAREVVFTPIRSSRANSNNKKEFMTTTFSTGFHAPRKISFGFNTKSDGFFSVKNTEPDQTKWPEINKTKTIFTQDSKPALGFTITPKPAPGNANPRGPFYFRFLIGKGNNDLLIRRVMLKRYWWKEGGSNFFHFTWQATSAGITFGNLNTNKNLKQLSNHFECHSEISTKIGLIKNLTSYCEQQRLNVFDITPATFVVDLNEPNYREEFAKFLDMYKAGARNPIEQTYTLGSFFTEGHMKSPKGKVTAPNTPRQDINYTTPKMTDTMYTGANVWVLKPTEYNQGRGIHVFNKLADLDYYLKCLQRGIEIGSTPNKSALGQKAKTSGTRVVQSHQYVIQKYLERPLLIDNRKFDIRVWVLVDHEMNLYCFKEKYIRLSGESFTLDEDKVNDRFVHLTNNAVQKYGANYNKFESGNIISFHELKKHLKTKDPNADFNSINKKIKDIIKVAVNAGKEKINPNERKFCFEVFGFDFIIDAEMNVWLIEINTNPSLDESNNLLSTLIPRMIDDALRLTIDKVFMPTEDNYRPEDARDFDRQLEFPVNGYSSDENLWEQISNLRLKRIIPKLNS